MNSEQTLYADAMARHQANDLDAAIALYRRYLAIRSDDAAGYNNLAVALAQRSLLPEARDALVRAVQINPGFAEAHNNLGNIYHELGQLDLAIEQHRRALSLSPEYADAQENLAKTLMDARRIPEALAAHQRLLQLRPGDPQVISNLGTILGMLGRGEDALAHFQAAAEIAPDFADAHYNVGAEMLRRGRIDEALARFDRATALNPGFTLAHLNRGNALRESGRGEEALDAYRAAMQADPNAPICHSNLLYAVWFCASQTPETIVAEHRKWEANFAKSALPTTVKRQSPQRLRVGFVSSNLGYHVVGLMVVPLITSLDPSRFEIACYSDRRQSDSLSERLKKSATIWRDVADLGAEQLATQIRQDDVDILIDLTLHMANNRMPMLAMKPAPVQASYLGYAGTTGLSAMDYRLTDPYLDPPDRDDPLGVEKRAYLPVYWSYVPPERVAEVNEPPCLSKDEVTFVNLNHFGKVTDEVVATWAKILHAVPRSRLMLFAAGGSSLNSGPRIAFERHGIGMDRLEVVMHSPRAQFVGNCLRADIALDPWPCNGGVTTMDQLWMGVAPITLAGHLPVGRAGVCILSHLGLTELIAESREQYVELAVALAQDPDRIATMRRTMRQRMRESALMDRQIFVRGFEDALTKMWDGESSR